MSLSETNLLCNDVESYVYKEARIDFDKSRSALWFETFLKYTNQKKVTSGFVNEYIKNNVDICNLKVILDIGCGEGEFSSL